MPRSAAGCSKAPSIASRTSAMSWNRCRRSFCRQRCRHSRSAGGVSAGSALQSGSVLDDAGEHLGDAVAAERRRAGQHLVEHAAERPDVGALVDHAVRAPARGSCTARSRAARRLCVSPIVASAGASELGSLPCARRPGEAEVEHLHAPVGRDLDVGRLEIAMHDAALVRRLERLDQLARDARPRRRSADRVVQPALRAWRAMRSASVSPSTSSRTSARMPSLSWTP